MLQTAHFVHKTVVQHLFEAAVDLRVQAAAVFGNQRNGVQRQGRGALCSADMLRQRFTGEQEHFQRAFDALAVAGWQAGGGFRVGALQLFVKAVQAVLLLLPLQFGADGGIGFGQFVQPLRECVVIHHGAAHNQRQPAARADFAGQPHAVAHKIRRAVTFHRRDDVDEVVRHGSLLRSAGLCRADVHVPIYQRAVQADDFAGDFGGDAQGERGFAAGGGGDDGKGGSVHGGRFRTGCRLLFGLKNAIVALPPVKVICLRTSKY